MLYILGFRDTCSLEEVTTPRVVTRQRQPPAASALFQPTTMACCLGYCNNKDSPSTIPSCYRVYNGIIHAREKISYCCTAKRPVTAWLP